nr:MAG: hypothetical protein DIU74_13345 [Pseudomonadota bacterium]
MALSMAACLVPKTEDAEGATDKPAEQATAKPAPADDPTDVTAFDGNAIAFELGDVKITADEVANMFDSYISMFSYTGEITGEDVEQCFAMVEDELIRYYLPLWKAETLGITLSEEEEAEFEALAREQVEEERSALLCQFAYYYGAADDIKDDASMLTEDQIAAATDGINEQLAQMFYEGFVFEDYLAMEQNSYAESYRIDKLTVLLQERVAGEPAGDDAIEEWYQKTLEDQKTRYTEKAEEYYYDVMSYESGLSETPVLYAPEGYVRVQVVEIAPEGDPDPAIAENRTKLSALEAEYGAILLNGGDEARKAEIETEYAALKADTEALEAAYYGEVREKCEQAHAALADGTSFEDVMDAYNAHGEGETGLDERLVYKNGTDARNGDLQAVLKTLAPGEYSAPTLIDGAYVIVKLVETIPEGPVDRASIEDLIRAAASAALTDEAWEEQFDLWLEEAKAAAVFHRETYEMIGDDYLYE